MYLLLLATLALSGCAMPGGGARTGALAVAGIPVRLTAEAAGPAQAAGQVFEFHLSWDGRDLGVVHAGSEPVWEWTPQVPGEYRVRTVVRDPEGKILAESDWSGPYEVVPPLTVQSPTADRPAPQTTGTAIRWTAAANGGAGEISYGFEVRREGVAAATEQSGPSTEWLWNPAEAGRYQARVVATDSRGNRAESDWSAPYEVVPPLKVERPAAEQPAPQTTGTAIRWTTETSGGVGEIAYTFELRDGEGEAETVQSGPGPDWRWSPAEAGSYQSRVVVTDSRGNRAESEWSAPYEVAPPLKVERPAVDRPAPRAAGSEIRWKATSSGGAGEISYGFELRPEGAAAEVAQSGPSSEWLWRPEHARRYQARVVATDSRGNRAESEWSAPYEVVPPLKVRMPAADQPAPQIAGSAIRWTVQAGGGVGEITYEFRLRRAEGEAATQQSGPASEWIWSPVEAGRYLVWVVAEDAHGNRAASEWSVPYEIVPPLKVERPAAGQPAPQSAGTAIRWMARASGGLGEITYAFELRAGDEKASAVQSGPSSEWLWSPAEAGRYQARVVATDARGNRAESEWSDPYEVVPPLKVERQAAGQPAPQTAGTAIRWMAQASGGVGEITYGFEVQREGAPAAAAQTGPSAEWLWNPTEAGRYQVRVVAADSRGNRAESEWSAPYEVVPPLTVQAPTAEQPAPQAAGTAIHWMTRTSGGVGEKTYTIELRGEGDVSAATQSGPSTEWLWSPTEAGRYQARVVATDIRGNRAESEWSAPYEIVPPLKVGRPAAEQPAPQSAGTEIRWMTQASGGVGEITYGFEVQREGAPAAAGQSGPSAEWLWNPAEAGRYQVRVVATDIRGNRAESEWSAPYEVVPPLKATRKSLIAVFPIENLGGSGGETVRQLRQALLKRLAEAGFTLLGEDRLEKFMARHRIRHVGSLDAATAKAFLEETGSSAVLITSLELYNDADPPRVALFSRLVSTAESPEIIWMDGVGMSGDDSPGILDLGVIHDPLLLRDKAVRFLVDSLSIRLAGESGRSGAGSRSGKFQPRITFDASFLQRGKRYTIGVLPFINVSERRNAGEIMALHFVRQLSAMDDFIVLEPGVVREKLLNMRIVMAEGISKRDLDVMSNSLEADLMLTGKVNEYLDLNSPGGIPKVEFSVLLMEREGKKIVWSSSSYNSGNDSVFFFDAGRISTAREAAAKMVRSLLAQMERGTTAPGKEIPAALDLLQQFRSKQ